MAGIHDLWLFSLTVLVLNATPGVDLMLTASRTLQHGVRGGLGTALGISAGCVAHTLAAAFGLAALLAASAAAFAVVKWVGAGYLVWLAIGLLRGAFESSTTERRADGSRAAAALGSGAAAALGRVGAPSAWSLFRQGLLGNVLNPKIALFFLALLPQFIAVDAVDKPAAFFVLGTIMVVQGAVFLMIFVALMSRLRRLRTRPGLRRGVQGVGGVVLLGLAARLALTEQT